MHNNKILLCGILILSLLFKINNAQQYRSLDGTNNNLNIPNAGASGVPYLNYKNENKFFADSKTASMLTCPHNYIAPKLPVIDRCTDILPKGTFPLPRCISNLANGIQSTRAQQLDADSLKSKRKSSHMMTYWADFIVFDIAYSHETGEILNDAILIPNDDNAYLSENTQQFSQINQTSLPFERSYNISSSGTINLATAYVDGSSIYGLNETRLKELRDPNNSCKMLLIYGESGDSQLGYLPKDVNGNCIFGQSPKRGTHVFVDFIFTVFLREHNRRCDDLRSKHGDEWDNEAYFQEARKWVIALIQRITYLEYLGILLGIPLPEYKEYNPNLVAGIDSTFITTTMRYGHSEVSDKYNIVSPDGETITTLMLHDIRNLKTPDLLGTYGVPNIASSLALQRQEEVDIFYSDYMRATRGSTSLIPKDIASIDHLRLRDRGVPLYNDVRELYGFSRATNFSDITQNVVVQERLKSLYSSVDDVEALVGGLAEDHYNNSNFGPLFQKSMQEQWMLLRDGDRFWFESPDAGFSKEDIEIIRKTTWRDVILRNSPKDSKLPSNLWFVQPRDDLASTPGVNEDKDSDGYPKENFFEVCKVFSIKWKIENPSIYFKMKIKSDSAWFGMGFNSQDGGMLGADFLIANSEGNDIRVANYRSNGYQPPVYGVEQFIEKISTNISSEFIEVQVKRPLIAPRTVPITDDLTTVIFAWNPNSNALSYHGGNRGKATINFFNSGVSTSSNTVRFTFLLHGVWMFMSWSFLFPLSIFFVRYMKHNKYHLTQHRNLQVVGGVGVISFGTAALAISHEQRRTPHKVIGTLIYLAIFLQFGLGLAAIWARASLESSNRGIFKVIKFVHFILGITLMFAAAFNVYLGIQAYGSFKIWEYAYLVWVGILCSIFILMEYWYSFRNRINSLDRGLIRKYIPNEKYDRLQTVSWSEVNQRVVQGAKLVVAEGLLFDIRRWINAHPGGARILDRVIGTDITNDFFPKGGEKKLSISYEDVKDQFRKKSSLIKCGLADFMDRLNSKSFNKSPSHQHSRFAAETLATMVVGIIENTGNIFNASPTNIEETQSSNANLQIFKRYTLIRKETVTGRDSEHPVRKFTFRVSNKNESLPKFLPGDYLEILSFTKGQVVVCPYTALQEPSRKDFSIIVKIYNNGLMSKHLDRQLLGFEIKMRGPFDIRERIGLLAPSINHHVLLNPNSNNGCWDSLFMICGGTGITPMIQLIEYHLEHLKDGREFRLFLLFANKKISDIIYPKYLDELVIKSNGKLKITYILSNPPPGWKYLHGRPNFDIIFTWLSKHYIPNQTNTHDDDSVIITKNPSLITPIINCDPLSASKKSQEYHSKNASSPAQLNNTIYEPTRYIEALENDPTALKIVVCGPPPMMKSVNDILDELSFPQEKVTFIN